MHALRFRQIHLDFHTSPVIPSIGSAFDKQKWQDTLQAGHVDSITCFAKCHHGWSYHETDVGRMHPHLDFDLLRAQYEACKEIDVNVPVYISAGVDNMISHDHPEWRQIGVDGAYLGWTAAVTRPGFHSMCFNSPYLDFLCDQIRETCALFPRADGIFLDIISQQQCCCRWCLEVMASNQLDAENESDREACAQLALKRYYERSTAACREDNPEMPVFHNSGHITRGQRDILKYFSHLELESLPTGGWGYDHFPMSAKYCLNLDHDFMGMTGKFHTTWGEFGGFKHPDALRYECAAMLAYGAKCSVGDQLHPNGELDTSTYAIIGAAYREVEEKEPWCQDVASVADIGLLSADAVHPGGHRGGREDVGAGRLLLEGHFLFDVIDTDMDFSRYKALVLPDSITVDDTLHGKLDAYLAAGGRLLLSGASGMDPEQEGFVFDIGAKYSGLSEFNPDYALMTDELRPHFVDSPMVMYGASRRIRAGEDGEALGDIYDPYFNRTFRHFCSHQHTPPKPTSSGYHAGVQKGQILYLAHEVFSIYASFGTVALQQVLINVIRRFLGDDRSVRTNLPSTARVTLMRQPAQSRYVLHLLNANTISRGGQGRGAIEVIDDLRPLTDVKVNLSVPETIQRITSAPSGQELTYDIVDGRIHLDVEPFACHRMLVLDY
jgi:hypothetical protein